MNLSNSLTRDRRQSESVLPMHSAYKSDRGVGKSVLTVRPIGPPAISGLILDMAPTAFAHTADSGHRTRTGCAYWIGSRQHVFSAAHAAPAYQMWLTRRTHPPLIPFDRACTVVKGRKEKLASQTPGQSHIPSVCRICSNREVPRQTRIRRGISLRHRS